MGIDQKRIVKDWDWKRRKGRGAEDWRLNEMRRREGRRGDEMGIEQKKGKEKIDGKGKERRGRRTEYWRKSIV